MCFTISSKFEIRSSETEVHPLFKLTDMPNQVRVLAGSHTDFSIFVRNLALIRALRANFNAVSDFEYPNLIFGPSSKKQAILFTCRRQYFINGQSILINKKGALLSPKGRTVKTK